jgi:hypothetical protein
MGVTTFELAGRSFPAVTWYKDPGLRKCYICLVFVVMTSVRSIYLLGFDRSPKNFRVHSG